MRPEEVLDAQGDLLDRLRDYRFAQSMAAMTTKPSTEGPEESFERAAGQSASMQAMMTKAVSEATTYSVSHDMGMVVERAADLLDGLDQIDLRLPPTPSGIVSFDRPFPVVDINGATMLAHWLLWTPWTVEYDLGRGVSGGMHSGIALVWLNDLWREPDDIDKGLRERWTEQQYELYREVSGRWATVGMDHITAGQRLGPAMLEPPAAQSAAMLAQTGTVARKGSNQIRVAHALWLMLGQTIAHIETADVPRASKRRAAKRKLPGKVTVIRLRREEGGERHEGESDYDYAHRWIVRGHWRWAHVSPHHHLAQEVAPGDYRARVWVNGHVKGPEGAPFKITRKVNVLDR